MRKTASQSGSEIRFGKVEELRRLFETGGYQPDPYRIAEARVSYARRSLRRRSRGLDPGPVGPTDVCVGYRLSVADDEPRAGGVGLSPGQPRSVRLDGPGEPLRMRLVVARAGSPEFSRILRARRARLG